MPFFICKIQGTNFKLESDKTEELVMLGSGKSTKKSIPKTC